MKLHTIVLFLGCAVMAVSAQEPVGKRHPDPVPVLWQQRDDWMNHTDLHYVSPCHSEECTKIWDPVCGCTCDGIYCRTFGNECLLRVYNCHNTPDYNFNRNGSCTECPGWTPPNPSGNPDGHHLEEKTE